MASADPANLSGARFLLNAKDKLAFQSAPEYDELAASGMLAVSTEHVGRSIEEVVESLGVSFTTTPPTEDSSPELARALKSLATYPADVLTVGIQESIKTAFRLLPSDRAEPRPLGTRASPLPLALVSQANQLLEDRSPASETRARGLNDAYSAFTGKRLSHHAAGLEVDDTRQYRPIAYQGGGEQAVMDLLWNFSEGRPIVAVEEPEGHLHPSLARQAFNYLKEQSATVQVMLTTHSPMMVDKAQPTNNWVAIENAGTSTLTKVDSRDYLKLVLAELGVLPSDIYLNDAVLFVEGSTERRSVLPIWAQKLGIDLESNVGVLSIDGEGNLERYLKTWLVIAKEAPSSYYVILDAHAGAIASRLVRELGLEQDRVRVWSKNSIEDYYPAKIAADVLTEMFGVALDSRLLRGDGNDKVIGKTLADAGRATKSWKVSFGEVVAQRMEASDIDAEVAEILVQVAKLAGQNPPDPPQVRSRPRRSGAPHAN